jgi:hypothetical protein
VPNTIATSSLQAIVMGLAFIAMQESSCNADAGGPTPGLMQVRVLRHYKLTEINADLD